MFPGIAGLQRPVLRAMVLPPQDSVFGSDPVRAKRIVLWLTVALASLGGGVMARSALAAMDANHLPMSGSGLQPVLMLSTALWTALVVHRTVRSRCGLWLLFVLAPVGGCLNAGTVLALLSDNVPEALGMFFMGALFASVMAIPLGLAYAVVLAPFVWLARRALAAPSLDGPEHVLFIAATWLTLVGLVLALQPTGGDVEAAFVALVLAFVAMLGVARRDLARALLLRSIRRGRVPGYRIDDAGEADAGLPALTGHGDEPPQVLRAASTHEQDPYRGAAVTEGLARVGGGMLRELFRLRLLALPLLVGLQLAGLALVYDAAPRDWQTRRYPYVFELDGD